MVDDEAGLPSDALNARKSYDDSMQAMRTAFEKKLDEPGAGAKAVAARSQAVDQLISELWLTQTARTEGIALIAVGGYGRGELFPYSDVDVMFLLDGKTLEKETKNTIRLMNQALWDAGLRVSPMTRTLAECERFDPENVEFSLSLLDARVVAGDEGLGVKLVEKSVPKVMVRDRKKLVARLLDVTRVRHAKYGGTLFHLEPNLKECPGGMRDAHVCAWLARVSEIEVAAPGPEFTAAREFLVLARCFLHLRHGRDDNMLDWQSQDEAAAASLGMGRRKLDAAYWMRFYFRHARSIDRRAVQAMDEAVLTRGKASSFAAAVTQGARKTVDLLHAAVEWRGGRVRLRDAAGKVDPAHDSEVALAVFAAIANTGAALTSETEARLELALPLVSAHLEDGPGLWRRLSAILIGPYAGKALRAMHALGLLELVIPEFHGIDALVIRDAYHRYTVDEHTFVVIDTLHALERAGAGKATGLEVWAQRFGAVMRDLPHPALLYLAALLHDTGKGHAAAGHAVESARMATHVLERLELDPYESELVLGLIRNHLEMSAALRRDVFDQETIRAFAARVPAPEALRMLTLFTYADVAAVHPDALTPWKAENLWRLYGATANFLDRNVDEERVATTADKNAGEVVQRILALLPGVGPAVSVFLDGFPRRYLLTRTPETIREHFLMAQRIAERDAVELRYASGLSDLTLVTRDRPALFTAMAGSLAAWGMNIVTADAFSNAHGLVVDSFRFSDPFRTLELNESERERFVQSVRDVLAGTASLDAMLASRRRGRRAKSKVTVAARVDFDDAASTHSTLVQVAAADTPGLLHALSRTFADQDCNVEVALVDTEGEMAIDVFYLTYDGAKLEVERKRSLHSAVLEAIDANAK